jgi:hypothetical protein
MHDSELRGTSARYDVRAQPEAVPAEEWRAVSRCRQSPAPLGRDRGSP